MLKKVLVFFVLCLFLGCGDSVNKVAGINIPVEIYSVSPENNEGKVNSEVKLTWQSLKDSDVYPWSVYFGETKDTMTLKAEKVENLEYIATGLDYGKTYYWSLKCTEEDGTVYESETWSFTTATADGKITSPSLTVEDMTYESANIKWDRIDGAESYYLYKSTEENGTYEEIVSPKMTIYYQTQWDTTNIHYGTSDGWTSVPGIALEPLTEGKYAGWVKYEVEGYNLVTLTFNHEGTEWDSNGGSNYLINESGVYEIKTGSVEKVEEVENKGFVNRNYVELSLNCLTNYFYKVKAYDGEDLSDFSEVLSFETPYIDFSDLPYLTWNKEDACGTSIVVNYETREEFNGSVEYGTTESLGTTLEGSKTGHIHHVELNNLQEDTTYYYKVKQDNGEDSKVYNFKTAGVDKNINYIVCSDMQDGIDYNDPARRWEEIAEEIAKIHETEELDFLLMPGDLLSNDRPKNWEIFFDKGKEILPYIPMIPVLGNHDTIGDDNHSINSSNPNGTQNFEEHFALPGNGKNYVIKYKNAHFTILNSEVLADIDGFKEDEQYEWAKGIIEGEAQDYDWSFVTWHIPAYTVLDRHGEQQVEAREITDFFTGNVDWAFCGHVHSYQRFLPMQYDGTVVSSYGRGVDQGVGYIDLSPAGNNPEDYENNDNAILAYPITSDITDGAISEIGFVQVKIEDKNIDIKSFGIGTLTNQKDLHIFDTVSYIK